MSSFPPGAIIAGRYQLVELLGRGGHGAVYRALQKPLGREVAIKMMLVEALAGDGALERFTREATLVQGLDHPNTVRLFDFGATEQGMPFIVFELLRGQDLEHEIEKGPMTPQRVGRVATQVLKALMEAHSKGIVHRDIKPSNILLLDYSGETDFVKVLDFGVARPFAAAARDAITHAGQIIGTPAYMAPEQVNEGTIAPATDLYALGLVMAEALTGKPVYADGSPIQIWMRQTSPEPVPLPAAVTSSAFGAVIARATRKAIAERYASAAEMLADVESAVAALNAPAVAPTAPMATPLRTPSNPWQSYGPPPGGATPIAGPPLAPAPLAVPYSGPITPASGPAHSTSAPSGSRGLVYAAIAAVTLVVVAVVIVGVVGGVVLANRARPSPTAAGPSSVAGPEIAIPTGGRLSALSPSRLEQRVRAIGWNVQANQALNTAGFQGAFLSATRGTVAASIQLYDYESPQIAAQTESALRSSQPGGVVERDGGRVLFVAVMQDESQSRALLDQILGR